MGGVRHYITQFRPYFGSGDYTFATIFAHAPYKGVVMASVGTHIIAGFGFYTEVKDLSAPYCKSVVAFAEYRRGIGY